MGMPKNFYLVRHGESEGNAANRASRNGDNRHFTTEFLKRSSARWRLTDNGRKQADAAGAWFGENGLIHFDRQYTSEYIRAMETAGRLGLPGKWLIDFYLRERDQGTLDIMPDDELKSRFIEEVKRRERDVFFWAPPGGESLATLCLRVDRVLNTLHRECDNKDVIITCHSEVMWAFRARIERMTQQRFLELYKSPDPKDHIHNCQILHYTRTDPHTGHNLSHMDFVRSIWPVDQTKSRNEWEPIVRPRFTSEELLKLVEREERLVNE